MFKHFPLSFHKQALPAAIASICAQRQRKFWPYHDELWKDQRGLGPERFLTIARTVGLDLEAFQACRRDDLVSKQVEADMAEGRKAGVRGTPSIFINGRKFSSPSGWSKSAFIKVIDSQVLKRKKR